DAFTVVVVLAEDADRRVGPLLDGVLREGRSLGDVVGVEGEGVGVDTGLVPGEGAGGDEQVGHALLVEVVEDGGVGGGAQAVDDGEDPVFGDQFAHDGLGGGGVVGVVFDDVLDVAAVDAALVVEVGEVGRGGGGDRGVAGGGRAGEGLVGADGHRVVGDAGGAVVAGGAACGQCDGRRCGQGRGGRGSGGGAHSDHLSVFVEGIAVGEAVGRGSGASGGAGRAPRRRVRRPARPSGRARVVAMTTVPKRRTARLPFSRCPRSAGTASTAVSTSQGRVTTRSEPIAAPPMLPSPPMTAATTSMREKASP